MRGVMMPVCVPYPVGDQGDTECQRILMVVS
jgi:hypothetical protein